MSAFAAIAADPNTSPAAADSLRVRSGADAAGWEQAVTRARAEMIRRTMGTARVEPLGPVRLATRDGSRVRLAGLLGPSATVIVFWSRYCQPSVQAMPRVVALAARLAEDGVPLFAVTRDSPAEAEPFLAERRWAVQVLFDSEGEAARALHNSATPQYFVVDGAGRLRFPFSSLDDVPTQVVALRTEREGR